MSTRLTEEITKIASRGGGVWRIAAVFGGEQLVNIAGDSPVRAASTMKLGVLLAYLRMQDLGEISFDQKLAIRDQIRGSGTLWMTPSVQELTIHELLTLMTGVSDNTATNLLIELQGFDAINKVLREFGVTNSDLIVKLRNRHDQPGDAVNLTTANDQVKMLVALTQKNESRVGASASLSDASILYARARLAEQEFNERMPALLPPGVECLHKTGDLRGLRHDSGVLVGEHGKEILLSVLGDNLESSAEFSAAQVTASIARLLVDELF